MSFSNENLVRLTTFLVGMSVQCAIRSVPTAMYSMLWWANGKEGRDGAGNYCDERPPTGALPAAPCGLVGCGAWVDINTLIRAR